MWWRLALAFVSLVVLSAAFSILVHVLVGGPT